MKKAIVLLSGGQDSTTCLYWALREFESVEAIGFDYGQRHKLELEQARKTADKTGTPYTIINLQGVFGGSSLVDHEQSVNAAHKMNPDLPSSFTAGRNMVFLGIAAGIAYNRGISDIVTGVCQTDFSGYPDCRREFIDEMEIAATLALGRDISIITPLMFKNKAETWKLAKDLGVLEEIRLNTLTDYNGDMTLNDWGYGKEDNPASILRAKGYREAVEKGWI